jgi:hypothetical protein
MLWLWIDSVCYTAVYCNDSCTTHFVCGNVSIRNSDWCGKYVAHDSKQTVIIIIIIIIKN